MMNGFQLQMITIPSAIIIIMYILGNILSVISLYILFTHAGLHNNFRMVVILLISFGILRSIAVYLLAASNYVEDETSREDLKSTLVAAFVYAICGFAISSLFLSIERCIAVYKPKKYERNSTAAVLPCITLITTLILTAALGFWANKNGENQIPLITVTTAAGFISLIDINAIARAESILYLISEIIASSVRMEILVSPVITVAITVWIRSKHLWKNRDASLGQRFQIAETNRTSPIYLSISVNESICISAMSVMGLLMVQKENTETMGTSYFLVYLLDACGAWRIIFINFTLIYYSYLARRTRQAVLAHVTRSAQDTTVDHFAGLRDMWK